jgi:hypothetical protein
MSKPEYDGCSNDCGYSQIPAQSTQLFENNQSTKTLFWQVDLAPLAGPPEALVDGIVSTADEGGVATKRAGMIGY